MNDFSPRPRNVKIAASLLWLALGITFLMTLWEQPDLRQALLLNLSVYGISFGLGGLTVLAIWYQQNWARWLYAALTVLGMFFTIPAVVKDFASNPVSAMATALLAGIQLFAIYLLFNGEANRWFKRR
jgi:peptidoglycan/LPS O-acetylase OafA/YrhL